MNISIIQHYRTINGGLQLTTKEKRITIEPINLSFLIKNLKKNILPIITLC
jgi:hypothetical protein